jgi:hypothetical protein
VDATRVFSGDYAAARERFRQAAQQAAWQLERLPIDPPGPNRERLTIDVALAPLDDSDCCLVLSSGLHGVEGFLGSAIQLALVEQWADRPETRPRIRLVFLHGLNPYGFAWLRRCDENNIDPNRNFSVDGYGYAGSPPGYAELDGLLNPKCPPSWWDGFLLKAVLAIARRGMPALKQAVAAGQYEFPQGLFYGGSEPSCTNEIVSEHFARWLGGCRRIVHLDIHTGLGPWATPILLVDYPLSGKPRQWLSGWFGEGSFNECDSRGIAYSARGSLGQWCVRRSPQRDYLFASVEFGTYSRLKVLSGIRAENQAHHWGKPGDPATVRAKQRLKELFCPKSNHWRQLALDRGLQLVYRAIGGLTFEAGSQPDSGILVCR